MSVDLSKVVNKRGPKCPKCRKAMTLRTNRKDQSQFWGCVQYPDCNGTYSLQHAQRVMDAEAQEALQNIEAANVPRPAPLPKKQAPDDELRALIAQRKKDSPW
jgi:ssDNA-binding Zn-finger/Zn-ribbon topoisomerase 1